VKLDLSGKVEETSEYKIENDLRSDHEWGNGGMIVLNTSSGDGPDSNGNIVLTAGTVIVHGPQSQPEVGIDVNGTFTVSAGF
jgi:hypothetical protein